MRRSNKVFSSRSFGSFKLSRCFSGRKVRWQSLNTHRKRRWGKHAFTVTAIASTLYASYRLKKHHDKYTTLCDLDEAFDITLKDYINIPREDMDSLELLEEENEYTIGFAIKDVFGLRFHNMSHSAISFMTNNTRNKFIIVGRQSPSSAGDWSFFHQTKICDEKTYVTAQNLFSATQSRVMFSGKEVKQLVKLSNGLINSPQLYTLAISNCYSSSVIILSEALRMVLEREDVSPQDVFSLMHLLTHIGLKHHYSVGVLNNTAVQRSLSRTLYALEHYLQQSILFDGFTITQAEFCQKLQALHHLLHQEHKTKSPPPLKFS